MRFRHELVRMAVEEGIPPYRQAELHVRLLAALEERGGADPALLAHHAEGAGDEKAVLRHAPEAARRSAALGAHRQAAAQYERALRFASERDRPGVAALQEGVAGEYSLLDRWEEAEVALRAALELRRQLGDDLSTGEDLRLLSRALWRLCRGPEQVQAAEESVRILAALPPGRELAWAYANLGTCAWAGSRTEAALRCSGRRGRSASSCTSLKWSAMPSTATGSYWGARPRRDRPVRARLADRAGRGAAGTAGLLYSSLVEAAARLNMFAAAERYYAAGMAHCEERELGVYSVCLQGWWALAMTLLGQWTAAEVMSAELVDRQGMSPVNRLNPLTTLGLIRGRRGAAGAWELLDEALALAEATGEAMWVVPARAARAELRWLSGQPDLALHEAQAGYDSGGRTRSVAVRSVAIWLASRRPAGELPPELPAAVRREAAGDWGAPRPPGSNWAGPTTPPWRGSVPRTRPGCDRPWPPSTS